MNRTYHSHKFHYRYLSSFLYIIKGWSYYHSSLLWIHRRIVELSCPLLIVTNNTSTSASMAQDVLPQGIASRYQVLGLVFAIAASVFLSKLIAVRRKTFALQRLGLVKTAVLIPMTRLTRLRQCHRYILYSVIFLSATGSCPSFPKMHILTISRIGSDEPCPTLDLSSIWMLGLFSLRRWL